jgi:uncharacterized protein (UPF0332 family)
MSFDWSEYLDLARELVLQSSGPSLSEARVRAAISRAYYAAFCQARNHLSSRQPQLDFPTDAEIHRFVREQFQRRLEPMSKAVAANLDRLRDWRNFADYQDTVRNLPYTAQLALSAADAVLTALSAL